MQAEQYQQIAKKLDLRPSLFRLLSHLFVDSLLGLLILATWAGPLYLVSQALLPILMFRAFALMHDCLHHSAAPSRLLCDTVGILAGAFCLLPYEPWKRIHLSHHKWSGNVDRDPSMGLIKAFPGHSERKNRWLNFLWRSWIPGLAVAQHFVFWTKSYQFILSAGSRGERLKNLLSIAVPLALYTQLDWARLAPGIFVYLIMVEVVNFPHHLQMPMLSGDASFRVRDQYLTARSCVYPRWVSCHVLNNFNLHIEHHLFPQLPWYRLPEARALIKPALGAAYTEVWRNQWIRENRQKPIETIFAPNLSHEKAKAA
jgi:fatty acid desaturase